MYFTKIWRNFMNILMPIQTVQEIIPLIGAGATEFYGGYISDNWKKKYNKEKADGILQISLNNRDREKTNFKNIADLQKAVRLCEKYKKSFFLVINAKWFPQECFEELNSYIQEIRDIGIERLIVSDIGLIKFLFDNYPDMKLSISCLNEIYNSASVDFYKQFNPERIVFPRHINIKDVEMIANSHKNTEFEVFVLSDKCIYDDGNCRCFHDWGPICQESWSTNYIGREIKNMMTSTSNIK
ncbi:hypothetical protein D7X87_24295 [bacterium D16-54]|nr:hypothetical protein D7X87_24295 [bacterium D16-54]RKJ09771.1 hypothetical protein D7X65_24670 [bacterium D16-56]